MDNVLKITAYRLMAHAEHVGDLLLAPLLLGVEDCREMLAILRGHLCAADIRDSGQSYSGFLIET
jgi:hypothetical protein